MLDAQFPAVAQMLLAAKADLTAFADVVGIFPHPAALLRLSSCVLIEADDEWQDSDRSYVSEESMVLLTRPATDRPGTQDHHHRHNPRREIADTA